MPYSGPGASQALVNALADGVPPPPYEVARLGAAPVPHATGEREITADQTNRSVVVGERVVVKWITAPAPGTPRAPALLARLAAAGFDRTAAPYAAVYRDGALAALVTEFLPDAVDGWEWCVDALMAGRPFAADLGALAAELHAALAGPAGTGDGAGWHARARAAAAEALELTPGEDGAWLAARRDAIEAALAPLAESRATPVITVHGDLHVGQVLLWRGGYAVIDFDGNPTLAGSPDEPQPAARDVAQLRTSLEHVARIAVRRRGLAEERAAAWAEEARADLLAAYRRGDAAGLLDEALLGPFEVEQECRELIYAARHLERWRYAPMGVLRRWFG